MDELGKLAELRAAGVVSQQEFDDAKARLLGSL
ncbi:SHOCT domain-containing protein [Modestobacter sp. VKM Ac-2982]|nr:MULTISPECIES: SHOCT domain-containing protein [unclassified Modestobacter]MCZ2826082.1 SHOCT domain-containing protein [Modestobacter sp. VKM Ac-2981]MCZ2852853.1 SHOCT domain-containing protein [Modestobacter sp. VKM Ac-2982]